MSEVDRLTVIGHETWPRELWWCEGPDCNEPSTGDPCDWCGEPVKRYKVVPEQHHRGAVGDAEHGRALVDRMFDLPRGPEWEQALAELRAWSMTRLGGQ